MDQINMSDIDTQSIQQRLLEQQMKGVEKATLKRGSDEQIRKVSRDLEAVFLRILLDSMQKTVPKSELFGDSDGMETWKGMFNEKLADQISHYRSIGLSDMIYRQLKRDEKNSDASKTGAPAVDKPAAVKPASLVPSGVPAASGSYGGAEVAPAASADSLSGLQGLIDSTARRHGLDPALISAVIMQESGGDPQAQSPAGAQGLMQLMPGTADSLGVSDTFDAAQNVDGGSRYLRQLLERFGGDEKLALAAYNAGPGAVERYNGVPPYRETKNYIDRVIGLKKQFSQATGI